MKKVLFSFGLFLLLQGCSYETKTPDVFITLGKLETRPSSSCYEEQLIFVSEDGEKLYPNNLKDFIVKSERYNKFQLTYQEIKSNYKKSCGIGKEILINELEPILN